MLPLTAIVMIATVVTIIIVAAIVMIAGETVVVAVLSPANVIYLEIMV